MIRVLASKTGAAAASLVILSACASAPSEPDGPVEIAPPAAEAPASAYERAVITAEGLVEAGNTQTAIDRLTQLLGDPSITDEEKASALFKRGELRLSEAGYDTFGAISDFEEIVNNHPQAAVFGQANEALGIARGKATSLTFISEQPDVSREDKFNALFALGQHQEAIDFMSATGYTPSNDHLVAMFQIGYLCEGDELTGPVYSAVEPDGSPRALQFCDLGK